MKNENAKLGRPKTKAGLRNFKFFKKVDDFIVNEADRADRDMVQIVEAAVLNFSKLKQSVRDAEIAAVIKDAKTLKEAA